MPLRFREMAGVRSRAHERSARGLARGIDALSGRTTILKDAASYVPCSLYTHASPAEPDGEDSHHRNNHLRAHLIGRGVFAHGIYRTIYGALSDRCPVSLQVARESPDAIDFISFGANKTPYSTRRIVVDNRARQPRPS